MDFFTFILQLTMGTGELIFNVWLDYRGNKGTLGTVADNL